MRHGACKTASRLLTLTLLASLGFARASDVLTPPAAASPVGEELTEARRMMDRKDWTAALAQLKRALRKDRGNAEVHQLMGYSYSKSGQLVEAFDSYRTALRLDPQHRRTHEYIGEAYLAVNEPAKAREHLEALRRICSNSCEEYRELAKALASWHQP